MPCHVFGGRDGGALSANQYIPFHVLLKFWPSWMQRAEVETNCRQYLAVPRQPRRLSLAPLDVRVTWFLPVI
jgi:hypothetical protein